MKVGLREVEWKSRGESAEVHSGCGLIEYQSLSAKENKLEKSPQRNILVDEVTLRDNDLCVPEVRDVG